MGWLKTRLAYALGDLALLPDNELGGNVVKVFREKGMVIKICHGKLLDGREYYQGLALHRSGPNRTIFSDITRLCATLETAEADVREFIDGCEEYSGGIYTRG